MGDRQVSLKHGNIEWKVEVRTFDGDKVGFFCNDNSANILRIWSVMIVTCGHADEININHDNPRDNIVKLLRFWYDWYEWPAESF